MESEPFYCRNCGTKLVPGARFCSKCGTPVEAKPAENASPLPQRPFRAGLFMRERVLRLVERFRAKGAISPDTAMAIEELGLGPRFQLAMSRRLGRLGIFVEQNGRYYLSEEKLKEFRDRLAAQRRY
jgi:hypothetical protein